MDHLWLYSLLRTKGECFLIADISDDVITRVSLKFSCFSRRSMMLMYFKMVLTETLELTLLFLVCSGLIFLYKKETFLLSYPGYCVVFYHDT